MGIEGVQALPVLILTLLVVGLVAGLSSILNVEIADEVAGSYGYQIIVTDNDIYVNTSANYSIEPLALVGESICINASHVDGTVIESFVLRSDSAQRESFIYVTDDAFGVDAAGTINCTTNVTDLSQQAFRTSNETAGIFPDITGWFGTIVLVIIASIIIGNVIMGFAGAGGRKGSAGVM